MNSFLNYESLAKKKDIDYNFYSELQDEDVLFDGTYLDLIINNLLSNAFKYTEEGERIYVKLYREDKNVVLQVADTGVGIPKDKQRKIFERFYQVENVHEGSGIGLSLVQRLVELHHGQITLVSEVGKALRFPFIFLRTSRCILRRNLRRARERWRNSVSIRQMRMRFIPMM